LTEDEQQQQQQQQQQTLNRRRRKTRLLMLLFVILLFFVCFYLFNWRQFERLKGESTAAQLQRRQTQGNNRDYQSFFSAEDGNRATTLRRVAPLVSRSPTDEPPPKIRLAYFIMVHNEEVSIIIMDVLPSSSSSSFNQPSHFAFCPSFLSFQTVETSKWLLDAIYKPYHYFIISVDHKVPVIVVSISHSNNFEHEKDAKEVVGRSDRLRGQQQQTYQRSVLVVSYYLVSIAI